MLSFEEAAGRTAVALDCSRDRALELADALSGGLRLCKVGMELYYAAGAPLVGELRARGLEVFLDLKLHDIPNTVRSAARVLGGLGAGMLTVHAGGGPAMLEAAREGLDQGAALAGAAAPRLLAVTVLTSMDDAQLRAAGVERPCADQALLLARMACAHGADGVVCSPREAAAMRGALPDGALVVTPGIRPAGSERGDQSRAATPADAVRAGATHIVVGRPVTRAADPAAAFAAIVEEVRGAGR